MLLRFGPALNTGSNRLILQLVGSFHCGLKGEFESVKRGFAHSTLLPETNIAAHSL